MTSQVVGIALAAGLGTRLRPISGDVPKPLVPFFSVPLLELIFQKFLQANIFEVGVNAHYLPDKVRQFLNAYQHTGAFLSIETPEILGTAGAYLGFRGWINQQTALSFNGDVLTTTDLMALLAHHERAGALVTLGLLDRPHESGSHIWVENGRVVHIGPDSGGYRKATAHGFACVRALHPGFFETLDPSGYSELVPLLLKLIERGEHISAFIQKADWFDLGTPGDYFKAHMFILDEWSKGCDPFLVERTRRAIKKTYMFVPKGETITFGNSKLIGPCFSTLEVDSFHQATIGPYAVVCENVSLSEGICIENAIINSGARVKHSIDHMIAGEGYCTRLEPIK